MRVEARIGQLSAFDGVLNLPAGTSAASKTAKATVDLWPCLYKQNARFET